MTGVTATLKTDNIFSINRHTWSRTADYQKSVYIKRYNLFKVASNDFLESELKDLIKVLERDQELIAVDAVLPARPGVFLQKEAVATDTVRTCSAVAHGDKVHLEILCLYLVHTEHPDDHLEVCADLVIKFIGTYPVIDFPAYIQRRMGRHKAETDPERRKNPGRVIASNLIGFAVMNEMNITIHRIKSCVGKRFCQLRHNITGGEIVIGIEDADNIACRHRNAFVHGIIDATVFLRDPSHGMSGCCSGIFTDHPDRRIRRPAIDYNMLYVAIILPQDGIQSIPQCFRTVISRRYN